MIESAFSWLGKIGEGFYQTLPQRVIVCTTQAAVVWWFGRWPRLWGAGWYVWWPLIQEMQIIDLTMQTTTLPRQTLTSNRGKTVGVGGWITYRVTDPLLVATTFQDHESTLRETAAGAVADTVFDTGGVTESDLKARLAENQAASGIDIIEISLSDYFFPEHTLAKWEAE